MNKATHDDTPITVLKRRRIVAPRELNETDIGYMMSVARKIVNGPSDTLTAANNLLALTNAYRSLEAAQIRYNNTLADIEERLETY